MARKRRDCALGIHFDFHAMPGETVPTIWKPEYYSRMLDAVKPDFVQCDTKGHAGLSSYPTTAGTQADTITCDILQMMRTETAKRGILLYGHHSGLYDQRAASDHPEWAVVDAEGNVSKDFLSVFGPYVDEQLLPQLRELAGIYKLDGAWVDGECWATYVDYSSHAVAAYRKEYGTEPPRPGEAGYADYREFCRKGFRDYVRYYVNVIKREFPEFEITSNWIFSAQMPEKMDVDVDFLSGDYAPVNSVESARFQGRVLEARNVTWDLIAWGQNAIPFSWLTHNRHTKELVQYCQEASVIVAMGGCFEFFNIHYGCGGAIQNWAIPVWEKTALFCRERSACFGGRIRKEFGVLMPCDRNDPEMACLYTNSPGEISCPAWISCLQDCQYSTRVLFEDDIANGRLDGFRIIAIPETHALPESAKANLVKFAENGGILLVDGASAGNFSSNTAAPEKRQIFVDSSGALASAESFFWKDAPEDTVPGGEVRFDNIYDVPALPAYHLRQVGKGVICFLAIDLADFYTSNRSNVFRNFVRKLISDLGYTASVRVSGSGFADLTVTEKDGSMIVNLINMAGEHNVPGVRSYGEIPPIGPVRVEFDPACRVRNIEKITCDEFSVERNADGTIAALTLERLNIHFAVKLS